MGFLFSFKGYATRLEWWAVGLFCMVASSMFLDQFGISYLDLITGKYAKRSNELERLLMSRPNLVLVLPFFFLAVAVMQWAATVKRFHDRGKSGFWALIAFVPFIGSFWILIECGFLGSATDYEDEFEPFARPRAATVKKASADNLPRLKRYVEANPQPPQPVAANTMSPAPRRPSVPTGFGKR